MTHVVETLIFQKGVNVTHFVETRGNIFLHCPPHIHLAHTISADYYMKKGIARTFRLKYGNVPFLKAQTQSIGQCSVLNHNGRYIFYMLTKGRFFEKPSYLSVSTALQSLRRHMENLGLSQVAMPKIASGLDKLEWTQVRRIIIRTFAGSNIKVHVYYI